MNIIKSFARRAGRKLSNTKVDLFANILPQYSFNPENLSQLEKYNNISLEVGFGKGENICTQAYNNQENLYIGCEIFQQGIASTLSKIHQLNLGNILIWPNDADEILEKLPDNILTSVFILFPDPWTKRRHNKRRFLQEWRVKLILSKLNDSGKIYFASDIEDYVQEVQELCEKLNLKHDVTTQAVFTNYNLTRYHQKALSEGRKVGFINIYKQI